MSWRKHKLRLPTPNLRISALTMSIRMAIYTDTNGGL